MKYLQIVILFLFLLVAAGCGGDDPTATPFVIRDPETDSSETSSEEPAVKVPPPSVTPEPTALPTETPTETPTPTATLIISTVPVDETPLAPGIEATVAVNTPDIAATIGPILTAFPDLDIDDIDLDALPDLPGGLELPGGIELPDLPLPPLPGG